MENNFDKDPVDKCIVCETLYNLQLCEECEEFVCSNKECLDPESINISTWICCLKCYQEKISMDIENQINDGFLDKCVYCGNIFYYDQQCDCYAYVREEIETIYITKNKSDDGMIIEDIEDTNNIFVQNNYLETIIENIKNIKIKK
jgi:hypothetical protein